jgi:hypothetical protein
MLKAYFRPKSFKHTLLTKLFVEKTPMATLLADGSEGGFFFPISFRNSNAIAALHHNIIKSRGKQNINQVGTFL